MDDTPPVRRSLPTTEVLEGRPDGVVEVGRFIRGLDQSQPAAGDRDLTGVGVLTESGARTAVDCAKVMRPTRSASVLASRSSRARDIDSPRYPSDRMLAEISMRIR